ncbi:MAG TPA: hypothetical protein VFR19_20155 [Hyphomicrobiaceae bacterium]|nr:hypothetical protein [Hyphomicrobiaceae bacterium]
MAQQSQTAAGPRAPRRARIERMPRALLTALLALLGALLAGAAYLLSVRGEALLLDLAAMSQRIFCF